MRKECEGGRRPLALVAQSELTDLAGSEILSIEVADALNKIGYDVRIFANATSEVLVDLARSVGVLATDDPQVLENSYDLYWINHQMAPTQLLERATAGGAGFPLVIFNHMSSWHPMEMTILPAAELGLADLSVANSPETAEALVKRGLQRERLVVLGNPAPDSFWAHAAPPANRSLQSLLVVSNHLPDDLVEALDQLRAEGITVEHVGVGGRVVRVTPELIALYDAVATIGKTVQYSLAVGRPVFCYDWFGGPGWLTPGNLEQARFHNFSGRSGGMRPGDVLARELIEGYPTAASEVAFVQQKISDLRWSARLEEILEIASSNSATRTDVPRLTNVQASSLTTYVELQTLLLSQTRTFRLALEAAKSQLDEAAVQRARDAHRIARLVKRVRTLRSKLEVAQRRSERVRRSKSWRLARPLRGLRR